MSCNCGSGKLYNECCEIAHLSLMRVKTAEQLMRSRYTAFTIADGDYLMESHHVSTRPITEKEDIIAWAKSVEWIELKILSKTKGLECDLDGTVEFKAFFIEKGKRNYIYENSKFIKENNCWLYYGSA